MKIAVAKQGNEIAQHFGHCPEYSLFEISGVKVTGETVIKNPGHQPGFLPGYLADLGVTVIIAGGMGSRAKDLFAGFGIATITGISGSIEDAVHAFLSGNLTDGENICTHNGACDD